MESTLQGIAFHAAHGAAAAAALIRRISLRTSVFLDNAIAACGL
jgi:hypothetical protein